MNNVYLSYPEYEEEKARALMALLHEVLKGRVRSHRRDSSSHNHGRETAQSDMANSDLMVSLASRDDIYSDPWLSYELGLAAAHSKPVTILTTCSRNVWENVELGPLVEIVQIPESPLGASHAVQLLAAAA